MGPTAVGKTAVAIELAKHFSTQIISADSRQCYKELDIGVAKPSPDELAAVPHYFISSHSIQETVHTAIFEQYALDKIARIFTERNIAVMVGGTGLYIKTFCDGIDAVPVIAAGIKEKIIEGYELKGLKWLQDEVQQTDPQYFFRGEIQNPHRLMRALEVMLSTGESIIQFQTQKKVTRDFEIIKIGLELPKAELYQRISRRTDNMIKSGLIKEAEAQVGNQHLNALQTVGYKELFDHFTGKTSLQQAIEFIKINTRHYAKRQMTWFKKDEKVKWCKPDLGAVIDQLKLNTDII